jgi:hypothetical protein
MKWTLLAVAALFASTAPASAGALKVGAGRVDITPPASIFPYDNGREAKGGLAHARLVNTPSLLKLIVRPEAASFGNTSVRSRLSALGSEMSLDVEIKVKAEMRSVD